MEPKVSRKFSREFKLEAVRLVKDRGVAIAQASRALDLHENVHEEPLAALSATVVATRPARVKSAEQGQ